MSSPILDPDPPGGGEANSSNDDDTDKTTTIRSPSPRKPSSIIGMGFPTTSTSSTQSPVLATYPHLAHYIFNLLNLVQQPAVPQHPLSVSSSGESDGSDEDTPETSESAGKGVGGSGETGKSSGRGAVDKEALVRKVVELLDNEEEEEVKDLLKTKIGDLGKVSLHIGIHRTNYYLLFGISLLTKAG